MDYPDFFPRNGFQSTLTAIQNMNITVMPYLNGRLFDHSLTEWSKVGLPNAVKEVAKKKIDPELTVETEEYGNRVLFSAICPITDYWQNRLFDNIRKVIDFGAKAVYIDQVSRFFDENDLLTVF